MPEMPGNSQNDTAGVFTEPQNFAGKYWYEVTEYPADLAPRKSYLYGKRSRARARRLAKWLSEMGNSVQLEGYDITEQWRDGKRG